MKLLIAVALTFAFAYPSVSGADWLYLIDRNTDQLLRIDPDSGNSETVGALGFDYSFGSMVWHPAEELLLTVNSAPRENEGDPTLAAFYWVDPLTASSQFIGSLDLGVTSSLAAYGITTDDEGRIYVSYTDYDTLRSELWEISLRPLTAQFALDLGQTSGDVDNLEYDPASGSLLTTLSNIRANPAAVHSYDVSTQRVSEKCTVQLPDNFHEDPGRGFNNGGLTYDSKKGVFWRATYRAPLVQLNLKEECTSIAIEQDAPTYETDAIAYVPDSANDFVINPGLNDAWYNPATNGQGFLISVFPGIEQVFVAWFTFDIERPEGSVKAILGEPGHRWVTAQGPYSGDTASLTINVTEGGVFDAAEPTAQIDGVDHGTLTIEFADCLEGLVTYEMSSPDISGEIPIQRITNDNVALCENLFNQ